MYLTLFVALVGNTLLWRLVSHDTFAVIIAIWSGVAAVLLAFGLKWRWLIRYGLQVSLGVWVANAIEFATQSGSFWESQLRQCGFYLSFAILSFTAYATVNRGRR